MVIHSYHRFSTVPFHKRTFCGKTDDNPKNGTKTSPQIFPQAREMYKNTKMRGAYTTGIAKIGRAVHRIFHGRAV